MTGARERVLANIRMALGRGEADAAQLAELREGIARHSRHIEPAFDESLEDRLQQKLEAAEATVARVETVGQVADVVRAYLEKPGLEQKLVSGSDELLQQINWPQSFEVEQRVARGDDRVSITTVFCAVAETGSLMLVSSGTSPTSLNFLPDYHIVVLTRDQLLPRMEDAWDKLREVHHGMPRTVNFISGPSKTADVEQTVEYGAHGPRCLHVILVG